MSEIRVEIKAIKKESLERAKNLLKRCGCKIEKIEVTENASEPIKLLAVCYDEGIADKILESLEDPDLKTKILPDELSTQPKWKIQKTRKLTF